MTEIAYLESRLGLLVEAEESSRSALAMHVHLSPQAMGLNHFILANADNIVGSGAMAVREYLQAIEAFRAAGPSAYLNLAMNYSELAMAYLQAQDLRSAEDSLQKSFAAAPAVETTVPVLDVLRRDTLVHIELKRGRLSDASKTLEKLLQTQGENRQVNPELRSHVSRDYGLLCFQLGRTDGALTAFRKSAALEQEIRNPSGAAFSLAMLGRALAQNGRKALLNLSSARLKHSSIRSRMNAPWSSL
jgi:tetratricopeptide (TPR) repeat protein